MYYPVSHLDVKNKDMTCAVFERAVSRRPGASSGGRAAFSLPVKCVVPRVGPTTCVQLKVAASYTTTAVKPC